ncbi:spore germination protein Q [Cytobacillus eiseniae]|uniref:Spore germination protein Q n=1 Tax=Cytobacillus eiseniae TaxID=762947 RepID=A0ABS4RI09_9BACI|nr:spore germination protein Q [Cytobacillus eiseniae]
MSQNYNQYTAYPYYGYPLQAQTSGTQRVYGAPPTAYQQVPGVTAQSVGGVTPTQSHGMLPIEQSYIENILRLNRGKLATVYTTFENNSKWNAQIFEGIVEAAGRDHLIISDPQTGKRYLIPMVYLDYVTFDEEIEYDYPSFGGSPGLSTYSPR